MVSNTGTYIDTPFHRYADGKDLSEMELTSFAGLEAIVFHVQKHLPAIDETVFHGRDIRGKAVLVYSGWDRHWNTEQYFENAPYLTEAAAAYLRDHGAALVGIDSFNIDDTSGKSRPVHSLLLREDIPIVEHLCNLHLLPAEDFLFYAVPPKIKQMGTFPVRAFAYLKNLDKRSL